jgi:hypothetical protein
MLNPQPGVPGQDALGLITIYPGDSELSLSIITTCEKAISKNNIVTNVKINTIIVSLALISEMHIKCCMFFESSAAKSPLKFDCKQQKQ